MIAVLEETTKICTKCEIEKSTDEFHKQSDAKDGLASQCKTCTREYDNSEKRKILREKHISVMREADEHLGLDSKFCSDCKKEKPISEFSKNRRTKDGYQHYCKSCKKEKQREYYTSDKGKLQTRKMNLKRTYGITLKQYDQMLENQNGVCVICGGINKNGRRLAVDHDHKTGKVRSLLCDRCNMYVGVLENKQLVGRVKKYLKNSRSK